MSPISAFFQKERSSDRAGSAPLLKQLGKHKVSGSCLHIKRLSDVDLTVLAKLVSGSVKARK